MDGAVPTKVSNFYGDNKAVSCMYRPMYFLAVASNVQPGDLGVGNFELVNEGTDLDYVSKMFAQEQRLDDIKKQLDAEKLNAIEQITHRDDIIALHEETIANLAIELDKINNSKLVKLMKKLLG
jgi:hypothetical protein